MNQPNPFLIGFGILGVPLYHIYSLLAQSQNPDPLSGGAGWVGAGLLGLVLCWLLLKHIPDKDKQLKEMITEHTGSMVELSKSHSVNLEKILMDKSGERKEQLSAFREEAGASRAVFEREQAAQRDMHMKLFTTTTQHLSENTKKLDAIWIVLQTIDGTKLTSIKSTDQKGAA